MKTEQPTPVYEYLRPEGTCEEVDYYLPHDCTKKAQELADDDIHCCVDVYPDGLCSVYLYDRTNEIGSHRIRGQHYVNAAIAIREILRMYNVQAMA